MEERIIHTAEGIKQAMQSAGMVIALYEPEIPANTGNIGRLCVGTGSELWLIGKCGFLIRDKELKRAGLDYWDKLSYRRFLLFEDFLEAANGRRVIAVSKFGKTSYCERTYAKGDILLFGNESQGLPDDVWGRYASESVSIPMTDDVRSINLSNSAAVVLYEALRTLYAAGDTPVLRENIREK
ncbi:MAG: tRNA (cytidine(34)-2'-O)-methyltransferase [Spirochaetota bacterium]